jgi:hypothetical protein
MLTGKKRPEYAICVANGGYDDLDVWKVYRVLPDSTAAEVGCIRVINESGEDYLYPADRFVAVDFPQHVRARLPRWQNAIRRNKAAPATAKRRRRASA